MSKELYHLFQAIQDDKLDQVKVAIKDHRALINATDDKGKTALYIAAEHGMIDAVNTLVKHGAHINHQVGKTLYTPLIIAVIKGNIEVVKYLIENGADIHVTDAHGKTALMYAQDNNLQKIITLLQLT